MRLIHIDHHSPEGIVYTSESLRELCQDTMEGIEEELEFIAVSPRENGYQHLVFGFCDSILDTDFRMATVTMFEGFNVDGETTCAIAQDSLVDGYVRR